MSRADLSAGKWDGKCAWLSEDVALDIHQCSGGGVGQRGWRVEIPSFLSVLLGLVGNLAGLFCVFSSNTLLSLVSGGLWEN